MYNMSIVSADPVAELTVDKQHPDSSLNINNHQSDIKNPHEDVKPVDENHSELIIDLPSDISLPVVAIVNSGRATGLDKSGEKGTAMEKISSPNLTKKSKEPIPVLPKIEVPVRIEQMPNAMAIPSFKKGFGFSMCPIEPRYNNLATDTNTRHNRQPEWWPYHKYGTTDCKVQCPPFSPFGIPMNAGLILPPRPQLTPLQQQIKRRRIQERMRLSPEQRQELEEIFLEKEYPPLEFMQLFEKKHGLPMRKIRGWFQNRRARERRQVMKAKRRNMVESLRNVVRPPTNFAVQDRKPPFVYPVGYNQYYTPILPNPIYYSAMLPQSYINAQQNRNISMNNNVMYDQHVNFGVAPTQVNAPAGIRETPPPEPDSTNGDGTAPATGNQTIKEQAHYDPIYTIAKETGVLDGTYYNNQTSIVDRSFQQGCWSDTYDVSYYSQYGYYNNNNNKYYNEDLSTCALDLSMKSNQSLRGKPETPDEDNSPDESDDVDVNNNRFIPISSNISGINPLNVPPSNNSRPCTPHSLCGSETPARDFFCSLPDDEKCHPYVDILNDDQLDKSRQNTCAGSSWLTPTSSSAPWVPSSLSAFHNYNVPIWRPSCALSATSAQPELGFETPPHYLEMDCPSYDVNSQKVLNTPPAVAIDDAKNISQNLPTKEENKD